LNEKRITCLLGAGAALEIGGPSSNYLTEQIRQANPFISQISNVLDEYYGNELYNFEDIFHALESLRSYSVSSNALKKFKPVLGAFINKCNDTYFNRIEIIRAEHDILRILSSTIYDYDNNLLTNSRNDWYINFWRNLNRKSKLDIGTLNYDTTVQQVLNGDYIDGFEEVEEATYLRFNPINLITSNKTRIMNLHGSIYFGYINDKNINRFVLEDDFYELYKYSNYQDARKTWFGRSSHHAQSGEITEITPIITGLRKTDKLIAFPMNIFNNVFTNSILTNSSLLVCGYSFSDVHINKVIEKMSSIHGQNRKIVLITYIDDYWRNEWTNDPQVMDWLSHEMFEFIAKSFKETYPFESNFRYQNPMISKDGCVRIYFEGFKNTVENFGEDIIKFLTS
jgi:hypothetical protein